MTHRYPSARRDNVIDNLHGVPVADPYRWLESVDHPDTRSWVASQNQLTEQLLSGVPGRGEIRARLTELWDYPRLDVPFERGSRWFQTRNRGLQDQPVLHVSSAPGAEGRPLLDPNTMSSDGTIAVSGLAVSDDGSQLAYATSAAGSDWKTWHLREVATGLDRDDVVEWSKFSGAAWRRDGSGFYYAGMARPAPGRELEAENRMPRILFHGIGSAQQDDVVVFAAPDQPEWLPDARVSEDDRYLVISIQRGTNPEARIEVLDLAKPDLGFRTLVAGFDIKAEVIGNVGSTFFLRTDLDADLGRVVAIDAVDPDRSRWAEVLPEGKDTLVEAHLFGGRLVCHYLRHAQSVLRVYELDGTYGWDIPVAGAASVAAARGDEPAMQGRAGSSIVHFRVTSFTESGAVWSHDLSKGTTTLLHPSRAGIDPEDYVSEQVFATSADGTRVPMFLTRRRNVSSRGDVPVVLYGYGGFDIPITPWVFPPLGSVDGTRRGAGCRQPQRRRRIRPGLARCRPPGRQAARVRRFRRLRPLAARLGVEQPGSDCHLWRLQRRPAGRRQPDSASGAVRGGGQRRRRL